jgi:hypothetical protein
MMAQNDLVVVGIDVAKDKVDACIRRFTLRQTFPNTAQGHRKLVAWLRNYQVGNAVMEASGGYERQWRNVLHNAGIEVCCRRCKSALFWRHDWVGANAWGMNKGAVSGPLSDRASGYFQNGRSSSISRGSRGAG